jgi:tetratricopeptide (TPR) repeat protein
LIFIVVNLSGFIGSEATWLLILMFLLIAILGYFRFARPIAFSTVALKIAPKSAVQYSNRGVAYMQRGNFEQALSDLTCAIELKPDYALAYYNRGSLYDRMRKFQRAIQDFSMALQLNPSFVSAYNNRGSAFVRSGDYPRAIQDYSQLLILRPGFVTALLGRAVAYAKLKDFQYALQDCEAASQLAPRSILMYDTRGSVYALAQDYQRALEDFDQALLCSPTGAMMYSTSNVGSYKAIVYTNRSQAYMHLKNYQQALQDSNEAIALMPQAADAYYSRALAYLGLMDLQKARADCARAYELFSDSCRFGLLLIWTEMCIAGPDVNRAERLRAIAEVDVQHYDAYVCRSMAYWLQGKFADAAQALEPIRALEAQRWEVAFWTGMIDASLAKDAEAINALKYAITLGLPRGLAVSLIWLKQERPEFYERYGVELLELPNSTIHL